MSHARYNPININIEKLDVPGDGTPDQDLTPADVVVGLPEGGPEAEAVLECLKEDSPRSAMARIRVAIKGVDDRRLRAHVQRRAAAFLNQRARKVHRQRLAPMRKSSV